MPDRYGSDVLSTDWRKPPRGRATEVEDETGLDAALAALTGKVTLADGVARPVEDVVADIWRRAGEEPGKA